MESGVKDNNAIYESLHKCEEYIYPGPAAEVVMQDGEKFQNGSSEGEFTLALFAMLWLIDNVPFR